MVKKEGQAMRIPRNVDNCVGDVESIPSIVAAKQEPAQNGALTKEKSDKYQRVAASGADD
jgi:hypothetical protein